MTWTIVIKERAANFMSAWGYIQDSDGPMTIFLYNIFRNVKANEDIVIKRRYKAKKLRRYATRNDRDLRINVTFDSDELADVNGVHTLKLVH